MVAHTQQTRSNRAVLRRALHPKGRTNGFYEELERGMRKELLGLEEARKALYDEGSDPDISVRLESVAMHPRFEPNAEYEPLRTPLSKLWRPEKPRDPSVVIPDRRVRQVKLVGENQLLKITETCVPFVYADTHNTFERLLDFVPKIRRYDQGGGEVLQYAFDEKSQRTYRIAYIFGLGLKQVSTRSVYKSFWTDLPASEAYFASDVKPLLGVYELSSREEGPGGSKLEEIYVDAAEQNSLRLRFELR